MKIKTKLTVAIGGSLILLFSLSFKSLLLITTNTITDKLNDQLNSQVKNITAQVSDVITSSARSYLTAVGERSNTISNGYFHKSQEGELSYNEAYTESLDSITEFSFLDSGTVFITDNSGVIIAHPNNKRVGTISPMQAWIQRLNPDDSMFKFYEFQSKNKLVYRIYNENFNYNICVDANTAEFLGGVDKKELNKTINSVRVGKTGYPFLITKDGIVVTNPDRDMVGKPLLFDNSENMDGINTILKNDEGSFTFKGTDSDGNSRDMFLFFKHEKNSELIVCLTGVTSEFYDTVDIIKRSVYGLSLVVLLTLFVLIFIVSSTITIPVNRFIKNLDDVVHGNGDLTKRISLKSSDEIGIMAILFNSFLDTIQNIIIEIKKSGQISFSIKNQITYRINETFATVKKIAVNIVSIKNQTKQLDIKVEESVKGLETIRTHIGSLNNSIADQINIIETTTRDIKDMISDFNQIDNLVGLSRDNTLRISASITDMETKGILTRITESLEGIKNKTDKLHNGSSSVLKSISLLLDVSSVVTEQSSNIKKEANDVDCTMQDSKVVASYVVESMDMIIKSADKITKSMEELSKNTVEMEDSSENLQTSINRFKT